MKILITGTSSGLGLALAESYINAGHQVFGLSRRSSSVISDNYHHSICDISEFSTIQVSLDMLLAGIDQLDLVILNAGTLSPFNDMKDTPLRFIRESMDTNVWSHKVILDFLLNKLNIKQVVSISSGASISGSRGWNAYALSKATLNMMVKLYANEEGNTHFCSFAPGLIDTAMQETISMTSDEASEKFPTLKRLKDARGTEAMPSPAELSAKLIDIFEKLPQMYPSGEFVDIRKMER